MIKVMTDRKLEKCRKSVRYQGHDGQKITEVPEKCPSSRP
ncbi:hypothetical protein SAMD00020551_3044 [Mesobacillus selenatarsenatis SF-1]|uniref:Uncharacterized protein n=1 Tax=Mesobacillus selenatarsenatis (strain DSM 18680 / JCM 14380 / FERM P-15431 / SF-1) TaxID=1321606 RepID=A0A0A8X4M0_MESS1|nr:hypothetical protein SAMD00020551_3044 [Mesobacillus selenatarsenatis SF-1]